MDDLRKLQISIDIVGHTAALMKIGMAFGPSELIEHRNRFQKTFFGTKWVENKSIIQEQWYRWFHQYWKGLGYG